MRKVVAITGGTAGVGRATADLFARRGWNVALIARDHDRLEQTANSLRKCGVECLPISADVADANAIDAAASQIEAALGPIDVWVNVAMATVFSPVSKLTPDEVERATKVTYLGQVHGIMSALRRMRSRDEGVIVCVGSALAYRSIPLQSAYCGAKFATRGFVDSLRSELIHDKSAVRITTVDLPAVNTPQFEWSRNKTGFRARPMGKVYQPGEAAHAIYRAAQAPVRSVRLGSSTLKTIIGNTLFPSLIDRYLAAKGYSGQLEPSEKIEEQEGNLFEPIRMASRARGRYDRVADSSASECAFATAKNLTIFTAILAACFFAHICDKSSKTLKK